MDFLFPPETEALRLDVRAFLADHLPADWKEIGALDGAEYAEFATTWRTKLYEGGWLAVAWPKEYGGAGLSEVGQLVVAEELTRAGVPLGGPNDVFGISMLGNTLLHFGTEEQREHFLPRVLSGEYRFCQGYSEPNAGSDLARVGTRAVRDGDEWIIDGQKIWSRPARRPTGFLSCAAPTPTCPDTEASHSCCVPWTSRESRYVRSR